MFISCSCGARASPRRRPGSQVRQEQPHQGRAARRSPASPERSEGEATGPHRSGVGWVLVLVGLLIDAYSIMMAQKRSIYNQLDGVHRHQLQKYLFEVSKSLKIETGSQRVNGKWEGHQWRIQRKGFGRGRISNRYSDF